MSKPVHIVLHNWGSDKQPSLSAIHRTPDSEGRVLYIEFTCEAGAPWLDPGTEIDVRCFWFDVDVELTVVKVSEDVPSGLRRVVAGERNRCGRFTRPVQVDVV